MPNATPPKLNASKLSGIFKASGKREHGNQTIQRRRLELAEMNRQILRERDLKLAMQPGLSTNAIRSGQRGSSTLALTSLVGALACAMIAVVATFGATVTVPRLGIVISNPFAAAIVGAVFGAVCGAVLGRWLSKNHVIESVSDKNAERKKARVLRSLSSQSYGQRNRFEQEWTRSNLG